MSTTFAHVPLDDIQVHPLNIRHTAVADDDMVASIQVHGLLEPLVLTADKFVIAGHRRLDGCRKAGLTEAPATIRDDLVTDAQIVEAMLVENGHRQDLTPVEEAEGYEQLQLFGYKPKDIAAAVGRNVTTVKNRLKLSTLPATSREKLHDGQLTLADAEALTEFADDPETLAELEQHIGEGNFRWKVQYARDARENRKRHRAMIAEFEKAGATQVEWPRTFRRDDGPWDLDGTGVTDPAVHAAAGCLGWTHSGYDSRDPELVCTDHTNHPPIETPADKTAAARAERDAKFEAERAAREAEHARQVAAARVRVDHMMKHFIGLYTVKKVTPEQLTALRVTVPMLIRIADGTFDPDAYMHAMGIESSTSWWSISDVHAAEITASTPKFLKAYAALQAAQMESLLSDPADPGSAAAWDWLKSTGYELSDIDKQLRDHAAEEGAA